MCGRRCWSDFEYETHLPSGENCGVPMLPASLDATSSVLFDSISTRRNLWSEPVHSSDFESGAQAMADLSQSTSVICLRLWPCSSATKISCRPVRSDTKAIHLPLGDQRGSSSRQGVSVTRCTSPRS